MAKTTAQAFWFCFDVNFRDGLPVHHSYICISLPISNYIHYTFIYFQKIFYFTLYVFSTTDTP